MTEQLTDEERKWLSTSGQWPPLKTTKKALRIIDVHAAYRAALVAQLEAARASKKALDAAIDADARDMRKLRTERDEALGRATGLRRALAQQRQTHESEVTRLTDELKAAERHAESSLDCMRVLEAQVAELTRERDEALADSADWLESSRSWRERAESAEAKVKTLSTLLKQHGIEVSS